MVGLRDRRERVGLAEHLVRQPVAFSAEDEGDPLAELELL